MRTFALTAAAFLAVLSPALAVDNRQLFKHASSDPTTFCNSWRCACINYVPSDASLYFRGALCEPGDYQGKNNKTEALAFCTFTNGTTTTLESTAVAKLVGATLA